MFRPRTCHRGTLAAARASSRAPTHCRQCSSSKSRIWRKRLSSGFEARLQTKTRRVAQQQMISRTKCTSAGVVRCRCATSSARRARWDNHHRAAYRLRQGKFPVVAPPHAETAGWRRVSGDDCSCQHRRPPRLGGGAAGGDFVASFLATYSPRHFEWSCDPPPTASPLSAGSRRFRSGHSRGSGPHCRRRMARRGTW